MPALSRVVGTDIVTATLGAGADMVTIEFDRSKVNLRWLKRVQEAQVSESPDLIASNLAEVIHAWDFTNDDGSPLPLSADSITLFPMKLLGQISEALNENAAPSDAEGKDLSQPPATPSSAFVSPPPTSPNGQPTSPSPVPSASPSLT